MRDDNELRESGGTSGQMAQGAGEDWKAPGNGGDKGPESRCGEAEGSRGCGDPQGHRGLKQGTGSRKYPKGDFKPKQSASRESMLLKSIYSWMLVQDSSGSLF